MKSLLGIRCFVISLAVFCVLTFHVAMAIDPATDTDDMKPAPEQTEAHTQQPAKKPIYVVDEDDPDLRRFRCCGLSVISCAVTPKTEMKPSASIQEDGDTS